MSSENQESREIENGQARSGGRGLLIGGAVVAGLLVLTLATVALVLLVAPGGGGTASSRVTTYDEEYVLGEGDRKIAVVPVEGVISTTDSTLRGPVPATTPEGLRDALRQAGEDDGVEALILEVNSPGGGVTASDQMYRLIEDFKRSSDKPVVVSMGNTAASGGYYISTAADEIVANETTVTGSLGVILQLTDLSEAADKLGVEQEIIKSGRFKDMGSPFRDLTPQERDIFQSIVNDSYNQFVQVIVDGRNLPEEEVRELADGRIYSGLQAKELDLVDELGGIEEAARIARERANVDEATVVRYVRPPSLSDLLRVRLAPQEPEIAQVMEATGLNLEPIPYYLYVPGL
ncbi:MAG: signal peptide peptidase SppA [Actinomycetota bacterium]|nr:signal peptide peptidase SppA [Actinomycetota bacterium]